jgi:4a-hydroxytetrahydrobiopterin dehydratase
MQQPNAHSTSKTETNSDIVARAKKLPRWTIVGRTELRKTYAFGDFLQGLKFVNQIAQVAESAQHHPDLLLRYGGVSVMLTTHDAGGLTEADLKMAQAIDKLAPGD